MKNVKLYGKITALAGSALLMLNGCGKDVEVIEVAKPSGTTVSDTTDPGVTSTYEQTEVLESNGTTVYYVTDSSGETTYLDANGMVTDIDTTKSNETISKANTTSINTTSKDTTSKDTTTTAKVTTTAPKTTTTKVNTTTTKATTTVPKTTTTTKVNTTTTKATTTTPKATTTTTTPQSSTSYTLNDIRTNWRVFMNYTSDLRDELMTSSLSMVRMSYGSTGGESECQLILAALNNGYVSDDVLSFLYSNIYEEILEESREFFYKFSTVQSLYGTQVDFTKYTIDPDIGNYLNQVEQAYLNGTFDSFMTDQIVNGNIQDKYKNNIAVMTLMCSYDKNHKYINQTDVDNNYMNDFINHISEISYGHSYTK